MEATPWTTSRDVQVLFRTVEIIKSREAELKNMMCAETSCTAPFADFQIEFATSCLMEIASRISGMVGEISNMASRDSIGLIFREALGPILLIAPWNASMILAGRYEPINESKLNQRLTNDLQFPCCYRWCWMHSCLQSARAVFKELPHAY
jgi:hypothetical protein